VGNFGTPELRLGAYEGPLDLLLELARAQRADLAAISVVVLAEESGTAVERAIAGRRVPLSQMADWLVMTAWLLLLRSRLLLPAGSEEERAAQAEAAELRRRLADREAVRAMADWLERRLRLGRDVFERGAPEAEPSPVPLADITELLRACHRLIALPTHDRVYRPSPPPLWRVPDALARIRALLAKLPEGGATLGCFLPRGGDRIGTALQRRAALASTFVAVLELGRDGAIAAEQHDPFRVIHVRPLANRDVQEDGSCVRTSEEGARPDSGVARPALPSSLAKAG
jgi:segregation and condensation protein A